MTQEEQKKFVEMLADSTTVTVADYLDAYETLTAKLAPLFAMVEAANSIIPFIRHTAECSGAQCAPPKLPECECGALQAQVVIDAALAELQKVLQ